MHPTRITFPPYLRSYSLLYMPLRHYITYLVFFFPTASNGNFDGFCWISDYLFLFTVASFHFAVPLLPQPFLLLVVLSAAFTQTRSLSPLAAADIPTKEDMFACFFQTVLRSFFCSIRSLGQ